MPFTKYLEPATMRELVSVITTLPNLDDVRNELLVYVDPGFVTTLPDGGNARNKIISDLNTMNTVSHLLGDEIPLEIWLMNAVQLLRTSRHSKTPYFEQIHQDVSIQSQQVLAEASGEMSDLPTLGGDERIVHKDDMLSFSWLASAMKVGESVARLKVPRYENESPLSNKYYGTGWIIGPQHIITNHHVINARSKGEEDASIADLHLQAAATTIAFDYNEADSTGTLVEVEKLCAWVSKNDDPSLDYAILKLKEPITDRKPLMLAPEKISDIGKALKGNMADRPPVNIIQHPGGQPKMLGVRNNQVYQLTEFELSYFTDTEGGSSGSPVCNDGWQVVALHRRWQKFHKDKKIWYLGKKTAWENRGTRIDSIIDNLKQNHSELWYEIGAIVAE